MTSSNKALILTKDYKIKQQAMMMTCCLLYYLSLKLIRLRICHITQAPNQSGHLPGIQHVHRGQE